MQYRIHPALAGAFVFGLACFSCSARIDGTVREGGQADLAVRTALEPRMSALIRSFQAALGSGPAELILDGPAIGRSMAAAPGIGSVSLKNSGPAALEGDIKVAHAGDFLSAGEKKFITFTEISGGVPSGSIVIALDRETAPEVIALLSADAVDYLSALMAPAATGEILSRQEYLELVASLYGKAVADEISSARIRAYLDFPGPVVSVRSGTASGRRAEFEVPLLDLLVLDRPLRYEVNW
ncbi:MAG: hypothetical protein LBC62_09525 [Treponema sp.]|jgi:hypothetical protein|nr:hypothetical protein [Treponema sp.]